MRKIRSLENDGNLKRKTFQIWTTFCPCSKAAMPASSMCGSWGGGSIRDGLTLFKRRARISNLGRNLGIKMYWFWSLVRNACMGGTGTSLSIPVVSVGWGGGVGGSVGAGSLARIQSRIDAVSSRLSSCTKVRNSAFKSIQSDVHKPRTIFQYFNSIIFKHWFISTALKYQCIKRWQ